VFALDLGQSPYLNSFVAEPKISIEPTGGKLSGSCDRGASGPGDPFVIMLRSPDCLHDPVVLIETGEKLARARRESRVPTLAFRESDEITEAHVRKVNELAVESKLAEIVVRGRRAQ